MSLARSTFVRLEPEGRLRVVRSGIFRRASYVSNQDLYVATTGSESKALSVRAIRSEAPNIYRLQLLVTHQPLRAFTSTDVRSTRQNHPSPKAWYLGIQWGGLDDHFDLDNPS